MKVRRLASESYQRIHSKCLNQFASTVLVVLLSISVVQLRAKTLAFVVSSGTVVVHQSFLSRSLQKETSRRIASLRLLHAKPSLGRRPFLAFVTSASSSSSLSKNPAAMTSTATKSDGQLYWNRETSVQRDYNRDANISHPARIIALCNLDADFNRPLLEASQDGTSSGIEWMQAIGDTELSESDIENLKSKRANVIYIAQPNSRAIIAKLLQSVPTIEWIHSIAAGIDSFLSPELQQWKDGVMTNAKGHYSSTLAEYTLMSCSYFAKDLPRLLSNKRNKNWDKYVVQELRGATMGIVGLGDIGRACARLAKAYGMRVVALKRNVPQTPDPLCDTIYKSDTASLNQLFSESDYILCSAPLTADTKGMIGREQFEHAKIGSVFINVGRGPIVDETALIDALQSGQRLKGAALDVFETEPLPSHSPLWEMENVLVSPHNMDRTATFLREATEFFVQENLPRFVRGEQLLNKVDPAAGY